ncbi:MAG TPA: transcriptional repressor LexA [Gemmatimonadaceae bacterium]
MSEPLTDMERRVYQYLIDFLGENTYQPSVREIARRFRIKSTKTVSDILIALANKGYIERQDARSRGVRIVGYSSTAHTQPVPLYGRLSAGEGGLSDTNRASFVTIDRRYLPSEDVILLKAGGEGVSGKGILKGDLVFVSPSARPKDGDIVATRSGVEAILKVFAARDDLHVLGVVCGVFRPYFEQEPGTTDSDSPE